MMIRADIANMYVERVEGSVLVGGAGALDSEASWEFEDDVGFGSDEASVDSDIPESTWCCS
jgi:hypothetical protein